MSKTVAVFGRLYHSDLNEKVELLIKDLFDNNIELVINEPFYDFINARTNAVKGVQVYDRSSFHNFNIDLMLVLGGDGTYLDATTFIRDSGIPILGINTGRLGFLSGASINEYNLIAPAILENDFEKYERATIRLEASTPLFEGANFALNEVTVHKKDSSSMISIHSFLDDQFINTYWADGLIVSTPTGSTAYSLSCGGPILFPGSKNFVITPVAPHNLNVRPIVIPDHKTLKLKIEGRSSSFLVTLDSRSKAIDSSIELTITKNSFFIQLLRLRHHTYLGTIRNKLNWGLDKRNIIS